MDKYILKYTTNRNETAYIKNWNEPFNVFADELKVNFTSEKPQAQQFELFELENSGFLSLFTKEKVEKKKFYVTYERAGQRYYAGRNAHGNLDGFVMQETKGVSEFHCREDAAKFAVEMLLSNKNRNKFSVVEL
jgi:hypothetical protein